MEVIINVYRCQSKIQLRCDSMMKCSGDIVLQAIGIASEQGAGQQQQQ